MLRFIALGLVAVAALAASPPSPATVTFYKDVLPVLQRNCQSCHRPGQIAPMSFLSYESVRPWAKAIRAAVASRKMPPWFADPKYGHFVNDRSLKQADIDTIEAWVDGGSGKGDPKDAPPAIQWPANGWEIQPDYVVKGPEFHVPAKGIVEWTYIKEPIGFAKDIWITSLEIKPTALAVVHHICIGFRPHTPEVEYGVPTVFNRRRDESGSEIPRAKGMPAPFNPGMNEQCYFPGHQATDYRLFNAAKFIPANADIVFQMHYTPNGTAVTDRPEVGFTIAKTPPQRRFISYYAQPAAGTDGGVFRIPPNDGNWASPPAEVLFNEDAQLVWMMPHMHLRGKDMTYRLEYPTGEKQTILRVPHFDFNWQLEYETDIKVPNGSKLIVDADFDNSANNKFNPDPSRDVFWGEQSWEEMMSPEFGVVVDARNASRPVTVKGSFGVCTALLWIARLC